MTPRAVLVGLPGSGKSTIGRRLARALGVELLDTDAAIEQRTGRTIADIFATDGEAGFRRIEEDVVRAALAEHDGVVSLGGGAVTSPGVCEALAGHTVVYLEISAREGVRRTGGNAVRPLLAGPDRAEKFRALMAKRIPLSGASRPSGSTPTAAIPVRWSATSCRGCRIPAIPARPPYDRYHRAGHRVGGRRPAIPGGDRHRPAR